MRHSTAKCKEANTKSKRPESPNKRGTNKENKKSGSYIYVDLSYVPHNGNSHYSNVEFFKRIRARYYVFSGTEPSRDVFNALLEAKQTWEDKDLGTPDLVDKSSVKSASPTPTETKTSKPGTPDLVDKSPVKSPVLHQLRQNLQSQELRTL
ncbi:hypothetical protein LSTR_LSTR010864 [Laodelphax striatellus]|uniref:Uncharacterized protein n=1 Tax=Laodelphax striatellus TaxID=195883 RepID=A0A482WNZ2_LAOST|nr:hypothetical protein LSTR_LSTR010864 [Laodelphax striatellus]